MPGRIRSVAWFLWLAAASLATWRIWIWHFSFFQRPGPEFYQAAIILIPALPILAWIYCALRRKFVVRREPAIFAITAVLVCAIYEPAATAVACALFVSCGAAGRFALRLSHIQLAGPLERIALGFAAGAGMLVTILFAAGLAALLYPVTYLILLLLPLILFWKDAREIFTDGRALQLRWAESAGAMHPLSGVAVAFGAVAAVCALMIALAPSIAFDPVAFHLPSVQYYVSAHALRPVPGLAYSYYPQGFEMLWSLGYALAGQAGAQMISALFFVLFALILIRLGRICGLDEGAAVLGAVFAATMPFIHWSGSVMKNDMALAFFEAAALLAFCRWLEVRDFRWIAAGTFFLAQALGVKLVAFFGAVPLAFFYGYAVWRSRRRWASAALLISIFLVFGVCWMARAYWLTGNPAAPLHLRAAVGKYPGSRARPLSERLERYVEAPWMLIFQGQDFFESPLPDPAGILLFALAPLALLGGHIRPRTGAQWACAIFAAVYMLYWLAILRKVRYAILPFSLLALWLAARARSFYAPQSRAVRGSLIAAISGCLLLAAMGLMIAGVNGPQFAYFAKKLDKSGYLRAAMISYPPVEYLREAGVKRARVFGIGNLARAYSPDPLQFKGIYCPEGRSCDASTVVAAVRRWDPEYLIIPQGDAVPEAALDELGRPARIYRDPFFVIYKLPPP